MPQQNIVIRCCQCEIFQSQLVKKSGKFTCVVCNQKQSIQKIYFHGSGAECRAHVMQLNMMEAEKQPIPDHIDDDDDEDEEENNQV